MRAEPLLRPGKAAASGLSHGKAAYLLVGKVMDLLATHIKSGELGDTAHLADLCYSLYRGIDYALINNEVPLRGRDLPVLLKQVCCNYINDVFLRTAVMVLMISIKNACRSGWFPDKDMFDLLTLAKEVAIPFGHEEDICIEPSNALPYISKIMSRFYPHIEMGKILASLKVKPGYDAFWVDFQISKSLLATGQDKIGLFVAQTDNMDTSSCLVTPSEVNFLLNGFGVLGRTVGNFMDKGPQLPTDITPMLKYGINLFQALGQFNGNYIIIIASASMRSTSDTSRIQDYIQPALASADSDFEIIEGPSRVSLNCPISLKRIKNPVKGHLCMHYQCFEYENFMKINMKRPAWRCPQCNQSVCYSDLRVEQNMVKILAEVGEEVEYVMVSTDGSWKAVLENADPSDKRQCGSRSDQETPKQCQSVSTAAEVADKSDSTSICDNNHPGFSVIQNFCAQREDNIMPRISVSFCSSPNVSTTSASSGGQRTVASSNFLPTGSPVLTDIVSNQEYEDVYGRIQLSLPSWQNQSLNSNVLQAQQFGMESSTASDEYGRLSSISLSGSRTPFSTQNQDPGSSSLMPGSTCATTVQSNQFAAGQRHSWPLSSFPVSNMASSSMQYQMLAQSFAARDLRNICGRTIRQADGCTAQVPGTRGHSGHPYPHHSRSEATMQSQSMAHPQRYGSSTLVNNVVSSRQPEPAAEQLCVPSKRMRGSLTGEAYTAALNKLMLQPTPSPEASQLQPSMMNQLHGNYNSRLYQAKASDNAGSDPPGQMISMSGQCIGLQ